MITADISAHESRYHRTVQNNENTCACACFSYVIVATGLWQVNKPAVGGQELIQHYDEVSVNPERFRGKNVLILGRGKAQ